MGGNFKTDGIKGHLVRLDKNGDIDKQFGTKIFRSANAISQLKLRPDDKLLVLTASSYSPRIELIETSGESDENFDIIRLQGAKIFTSGNSNEIYVSGNLDKIKGGIKKYDKYGKVVSNFNTGTRFDRGHIEDIEVDKNGDVWVTGMDLIRHRNSSKYSSAYFVEKLNADGAPIKGFSKPNLRGNNSYLRGTSFVPNFHFDFRNDIYLLGPFLNLSSKIKAAKIIRLNADFTLDTTFVTKGLPTDKDHVTNIFVDNQGRYLVSFETKLFRLFPDGSLDTSFENGKKFEVEYFFQSVIKKVRFLSNGDFITISETGQRSYMLRWNESGHLDEGFKTNYGYDAVEDSKERILLLADRYDDIEFGSILRIGLDNEIDQSFNTGGLIYDARHIIVDSFDQPIIIGSKDQYNWRLFRLRESGIEDRSFNELVFSHTGYSVNVPSFELLQSDQIRFVVVGDVYHYMFAGAEKVKPGQYTVLNKNGDIVKNPGSKGFLLGNDYLLNQVDFLTDGSILVGGTFSRLKVSQDEWILHNFLSRFNHKGEWDFSFGIK